MEHDWPPPFVLEACCAWRWSLGTGLYIVRGPDPSISQPNPCGLSFQRKCVFFWQCGTFFRESVSFVCVCMYACISVCLYMSVCMYVCMSICMYACMHDICMYVCLYARMYACHVYMYVYVGGYVCRNILNKCSKSWWNISYVKIESTIRAHWHSLFKAKQLENKQSIPAPCRLLHGLYTQQISSPDGGMGDTQFFCPWKRNGLSVMNLPRWKKSFPREMVCGCRRCVVLDHFVLGLTSLGRHLVTRQPVVSSHSQSLLSHSRSQSIKSFVFCCPHPRRPPPFFFFLLSLQVFLCLSTFCFLSLESLAPLSPLFPPLWGGIVAISEVWPHPPPLALPPLSRSQRPTSFSPHW